MRVWVVKRRLLFLGNLNKKTGMAVKIQRFWRAKNKVRDYRFVEKQPWKIIYRGVIKGED